MRKNVKTATIDSSKTATAKTAKTETKKVTESLKSEATAKHAYDILSKLVNTTAFHLVNDVENNGGQLIASCDDYKCELWLRKNRISVWLSTSCQLFKANESQFRATAHALTKTQVNVKFDDVMSYDKFMSALKVATATEKTASKKSQSVSKKSKTATAKTESATA